MEPLHILIVVGLVHFSLFFFNTIFVSCMHLPYLSLQEKCGLEIQFLRLKWFTTAFNRSLMKWGLNHSKFWALWFNAGLITAIVLLPISVFIVVKMNLENWFQGSTSPGEKKEQVLELMVPGIDIPFNQIGFYVFSLLLSSGIHELGHAMAAVKEDVRFFGIGMVLFFIIPVAFVHLNDEQLNSLSIKSRLRVLCAGVWHNVVLAMLAIILIGVITILFSPFFKTNSGVFVRDITATSPVLGPSGLTNGDVIHSINDCPVKNVSDWKHCILNAIKFPTPGYCVTDRMVKEIDKSLRIQGENTSIRDCCDEYSKDKGYLCYQYLLGFDVQTPPSTTHSCLPSRVIVESSHSSCQSNDHCVLLNDLCIKPVLDNVTKIVQIQRYGRKDVIYLGHPAEIYYSIELSDWVPRFGFLSPNLPETFILFCKYTAQFSAGLAIINVIPCFYFDGQHIVTLLIDVLFRRKIQHHSIRSTIASIVKITFTLLLGNILVIMYLNKF
ncbi:hypothetical protein QAD02_017890 [Eretmocerus hayati]|uniref:Uncharacterized protein n=1 Tax=Eretmocerus hayati TaxID=131215 RepID=A0ACC2PGA1_9HYME|nr:hypothetical protein QAD02_017890 [Eretmocerus hayati]